MFSFVESSLAEVMLRSLRDLAMDFISSASAIGVAAAIGAALFTWTHRTRRSGRPQLLPATA
jgi:hypothetical protein